MDALIQVLRTLPWWAWIAIVAIIGGTVRSIVKMSHQHQERMEMIRHGVDPGAPSQDDD